MITFEKVNAALKAEGLDGFLCYGKEYLYFGGPSFEMAPETGVYGVRTLNSLTVAQWTAEAKRIAESAK